MKTLAHSALLLLGTLIGPLPSPRMSCMPSGDGPDSLVAAIQRSREAEQEWLRTSPTSYLAAIARVDFGEATSLTIGSAPDNDVVIPERVFLPRHLSVTVVGDSFRVEPLASGAAFRWKDDTISVATMVPPAYISVGRFSIRLSHQHFPAIIVFDPRSPRFGEYKGLKYFPVDTTYRFVLPMTRYSRPDTTVILSTRGNRRLALREGMFSFRIRGVPCTLEVSRLLEPGIGENMYSIFFTDRTTGRETYAVGRYLDLDPPSNGLFVVDFNRAYNPACAVSPFYNCPLPPDANALPVRIPAGEKDPGYLHD